VRNLDLLTSFYSGLFGLEVVEAQENDFAHLEAGGVAVSIVKIPVELSTSAHLEETPPRRSETPVKLSLPVASIANARMLALDLGGLVCAQDTEWSWRGGRRCDAIDPEGNVVQIVESDQE